MLLLGSLWVVRSFSSTCLGMEDALLAGADLKRKADLLPGDPYTESLVGEKSNEEDTALFFSFVLNVIKCIFFFGVYVKLDGKLL